MPEGEETESPLDKYVRFKNNIKLWYKEMSDAGLTREEQQTLEPYFLKSYGVPPSQEQSRLADNIFATNQWGYIIIR